MPIKPIFVFSVSRSGSTLLQRIIAAHEGVATVSEPWLLLPYLYTFRPQGVVAEYTHPWMVAAIEDFCKELPAGADDYRQELHDFVLRLYEKAAGKEARFFLDKSPYSFIAEEIMNLFPEGKFVFLWRNPLSVIASIITTWEHSRWKPTLFRGELFVGLPRLVEACQRGEDRAHSVHFEDLVTGDHGHWRSLMDYLEIEFDPNALTQFSNVKLNGRMGDPTGIKRYSTLSTEPMQKWTGALANPLRKEWCRRYLRFLGDDRLAVMGYERRRLIAELDSQPTRMDSLLPDLMALAKDVAKEPIRVRTFGKRLGGPNVIRELLRA